MSTRIFAAAFALAALAFHAPAAHADHARYDCNFDTFAQETLTGGDTMYTGIAWGSIASPTPGEAVSIRCYVTVDGVEVASAPTGSGTSAAATAGRVSFTASDEQVVWIGAEWAAGDEGGNGPMPYVHGQLPPQEVIDLLDEVFDETVWIDPALCGALKAAGVPAGVNGTTAVTGLSVDTDDCDVRLNGELLVDLAPYES